MAIRQADIDAALELFEPVGPVKAKRMMGGLMLSYSGLAFALYDPDQGYFLKTDAVNRPDFEAEDLQPFSFEFKNGKTGTMNYHFMPERCYDDPDELRLWALKSVDVALRAAAKKKPRKK